MRHKTMLKNAISHDLMGVDRTNLFRSGLKLRLGLMLLIGAGLFFACSGDEKGPNGGETPVIPDVPSDSEVFEAGVARDCGFEFTSERLRLQWIALFIAFISIN